MTEQSPHPTRYNISGTAATLNPRDSRAWDYLALNLEPMGDLAGAEQAYKKGLQVNQPGRYYDAFLDYNYGRFLEKRNDLAASKQHMDRAVELAPKVRAVWYERAKLNLRTEKLSAGTHGRGKSGQLR